MHNILDKEFECSVCLASYEDETELDTCEVCGEYFCTGDCCYTYNPNVCGNCGCEEHELEDYM